MYNNVPMEYLIPCTQLDIHGVYTFYSELHCTLSISKLTEIRACPERLMLLLSLQFCDLKCLVLCCTQSRCWSQSLCRNQMDAFGSMQAKNVSWQMDQS